MEYICYCRCSTSEEKQDVNRQVRELKKKYKIKQENIFIEYASGTKTNRVELKKALNAMKSGYALVSTECSRITRSTKQLCDIVEMAKENKWCLIFGEFILDCSKDNPDPMTEGMLKMMAVFAEIERNLTSARVKSGLENAKAKGKQLGRKKTTIKDIPKKVIDMYSLYESKQINKVDYAKLCNITRPTLDKYLSLLLDS